MEMENKNVGLSDDANEAFDAINRISHVQSTSLSEQGRHVFYAMFAAAWATLWANKGTTDMAETTLLLLVLCIGVIYLILHLGRYYAMTTISRKILDDLETKRCDGDRASIRMNVASDNAFKVMKIEIFLLCLMGAFNIIYYIWQLFAILVD